MKNTSKIKFYFTLLLISLVSHNAFSETKALSGSGVDYTNHGSDRETTRIKKVKYNKRKLLKISDDAKRTRIKRKNGLVYKVISEIIFPEKEEELDSDVGRMTLFGKNNKKNCEADVFFNNDSSIFFAAIYDEKNNLVREFYLDHPNMKYSNILFQYMLSETNKAGKISKAAIVIESKNSSFKMVRGVSQTDFVFSSEGQLTEYCMFDMALTQYYDGEEE